MQFTGPLTAKGVEDTTFYVYNPLISHDEVGDAPDVLGSSVREFHEKMVRRAISNPLSLNATATHDTKRGEDARMRLNLLSEVPEVWSHHVASWMEVNRDYKVLLNDVEAPSINDEYFIYQSIVGGFPENLEPDNEWKGRLKEYLVKVVREGKMYSSWETPDERYEDACGRFVDAILQSGSKFLITFMPFIKNLINQASLHSVSQVVVKVTAPGIPDIYQGCELWDLSFVDPDNRRPVDYDKRIQFLGELKAHGNDFTAISKVLDKHRESGIVKLFAMSRTLSYRRDHQQLFHEGTYIPLVHLGEGSGVFGYARNLNSAWCLVVVPLGATVKNVVEGIDLGRNFISLPANSPRRWRNIFTNKLINASDEKVSLQELFADFPVAVLAGEEV
jgi:(1->4)-alpha-D-glucan 1-alpha-D-glucosylmutase